ncbi:MAG: hypothetical protein IT289_07500 [Oligoflexia bacterium]|nr:hypothetical protein [Oligoflexia bacterium]
MALDVPGFLTGPPNDSCAVAIKLGTCEIWRCDDAIQKRCQDSQSSEITIAEWRNLAASLFAEKNVDLPPVSKVPNESCAMGIVVSGDVGLKCDQGHYFKEAESKEFHAISNDDWNKKIQKLIF